MQGSSFDAAASVEIYDQVYRLRGIDPGYITQLSELVDGKMRAVAAHGTTVDTLRVAVLAALNLADELVELRNRHRELVETLERTETRTRACASSLSEMLDGAIAGDYRERIAG